MEQLAFILLPIWLMLLAIWIFRDSGEYESFKLLSSSEERQQYFRRWILYSFLLFGCGALASLILIGHVDSLFCPVPELAALTSRFTVFANDGNSDENPSSFVFGLLIGGAAVIGVLIGVMLTKRRQKATKDSIKTVGDIQALIPKNNRERKLAVILSLNAGFSEELFFRLMMPILILLVTGSPLFAIIASLLLFGFVHWYQGWIGIVATTIMGSVLMAVYLFSGLIWVAMAAHALIDLNGLLLMPALQSRGRSTKPAHRK